MKRALFAALLLSGAAHAQSGKPIELYIGYSVGGGYDVYARLLARHMGKHIPGNPVIVPKNMEGAGSLRLANWLYKAAARDGTVFGTIGRGIAFDPLLGTEGAQFKASQFGWIGSANDEVSVCASWGKTGITRFEDFYGRTIFVGGTGAGADTDVFPKAMNAILGTIKLLVQLSLEKHADLPDVPLIMDMVKSPEQRAVLRLVFARQVMGRPFLAPPGVPAERLAMLRRAFMDTMKDAAFLAEAEKIK